MQNNSDCVKTRQLEVFIPFTRNFKIISEANTSEHWTKKRKRIVTQQKTVFYSLMEKKLAGSIELPCSVTMSRYGSKPYDDDNLVAAMKHVRDAIANFIHPGLAPGQADNDPNIRWVYIQCMIAKKDQHGLRIEIC